MCSFIIVVIFPFYIKDLGGTEMTVGLTAAGFALSCILMRPAAGWLLDNKSRGGLLKFGVIGLVIISVLFIISPVLSVVVILRLLSGFAFSATGTACNTSAFDTIPKSRFSEGLAFLGLGNTLASALGPALGLMIMARMGFGFAFFTMALFAAGAAGITQKLDFKKIQRRIYLPGHNQPKLSDLFNAAALPASVLILFSTAGFSSVNTFIALYGQLSGLGSGGLFFMLLAVGTGSTRLFGGRLADKKGELPMVLIGNICFFTGFLLLLFENSTCYHLSGLFFGIGSGLFNPAMQAMAARTVPPEKLGAATSTFLCFSDIGMGLGGLSAGALVTILGYRPMFAVMIITVVLSLLAYSLWASKTASAFRNYIKTTGG